MSSRAEVPSSFGGRAKGAWAVCSAEIAPTAAIETVGGWAERLCPLSSVAERMERYRGAKTRSAVSRVSFLLFSVPSRSICRDCPFAGRRARVYEMALI